jgi:hypothetical protein
MARQARTATSVIYSVMDQKECGEMKNDPSDTSW